jgi:hypothetical protein
MADFRAKAATDEYAQKAVQWGRCCWDWVAHHAAELQA